jgi:hypothetical protein
MVMNKNFRKVMWRTLIAAGVSAGMQLAGAALFGPCAQAQTADEIVAKVLAARGGLAKIKAVKSQRITGTIYFSPEFYGPFVAEFKRPGKMHNEVVVQNKTVVRTISGKNGGWVLNPFGPKTGAEAMSEAELKDATNEADFDGPLVDSKVKGVTIEFGGTGQVEGRDAYILKLTHSDGKVSNYSFDAKTYLMAKWSGTDVVNGEAVARETLFRDYRDVGGLKFAFELVSNNPGTDMSQRIVVEKIEVDPEIDESRFGKPKEAAAAPGADAPATRP